MATIELEDLPSGHISQSEINKYRRCPRAHKFHYIDKLKESMGAPAVRGMAIHDSTEWFGKGRLKGEMPTLSGLQKYYEDHSFPETIESWERRGGITWKDYSAQEMHDDGLRALAAWHGQPAREYSTDKILPAIGENLAPRRVEETIDVLMEGLPWHYVCRLDVLDMDHILRDLKTTGKNSSENMAMISDQLTWEQMALENIGEKVFGLEIDQLVILKGRVDVVVHRAAPRTPEEIAEAMTDMGEVVRAIEARQFPRVRDWMTCKTCAFLPMCSPSWDNVRRIAEQQTEKKAEAKAGKPARAGKFTETMMGGKQ